MYLKKIADEIGDSLNDTTLKSTGSNYSRVKNAINEFLFLDFLPLIEWNFLNKNQVVATIAEYTTGTVSATNGSTTITGSGTTFTSSMVGYRIWIEGSSKSYKISAYSSATSITIDSSYEEDSVSGATYHICKDRYSLPRWVDDPSKIVRIVDRKNNKPLTQLSEREMELKFSSKIDVNDPKYYSIGQRERTTYTTGTVSGTSATKTLTGSSTAWTSSSIEQYDTIRVGNYVYTVDSVDSATQITLIEDIVTTISGGTSYTANLDRWKIDFYPLPKYVRGYALTAQTLMPRLDDDYDVPLLPDNWHYILVKGGRCKMLKHNQDPNYSVEMAELTQIMKRLISANNRETDRLETLAIA